jgi:hypothetical protein
MILKPPAAQRDRWESTFIDCSSESQVRPHWEVAYSTGYTVGSKCCMSFVSVGFPKRRVLGRFGVIALIVGSLASCSLRIVRQQARQGRTHTLAKFTIEHGVRKSNAVFTIYIRFSQSNNVRNLALFTTTKPPINRKSSRFRDNSSLWQQRRWRYVTVSMTRPSLWQQRRWRYFTGSGDVALGPTCVPYLRIDRDVVNQPYDFQIIRHSLVPTLSQLVRADAATRMFAPLIYHSKGVNPCATSICDYASTVSASWSRTHE